MAVIPNFSSYQATSVLERFAERPFDLTKPENLTPHRLQSYVSEGGSLKLLYGTQRVNDDVMDALKALAVEAKVFEKMQKMQSGEVINLIHGYPSENRPVLHTATRDFFGTTQSGAKAKEAAKNAYTEIEKLKRWSEKLDKENRFTDLVMIGIGGSDLGPRAHYIALQHLQKKGRHVHFIANVDPDETARLLPHLNLSKTLVVVVSKTGTTLETATNEAFARQYFEKAGLKPSEHFISVSMQKSPLDNPKTYVERFYIWDWIGGRYSTTSMVGGVMLSFAFGFPVFWELLEGANQMDKQALNQDFSKNPALVEALLGIWNRDFLHYPTLAIIPYSQALGRFPAHIQQLDMESNGKHIDKEGRRVNFETGPIIWGEPGTNAQHSFYQLLHQGTSIVPMELIGFAQSQLNEDFNFNGTSSQQKLLASMLAQALALAQGQKEANPNKGFEGNRPSSIILGKQLTPKTLGALLAFYEHKVAFQGFIWNINSFDQEGVQLGKVLANKIIARFAAQNAAEQPKDEYPLADSLLKHVNSYLQK